MQKQLTRQEEISDALISLGLSRNMACVLAYMQDNKEAISGDIEQATNLRQPEVSIAIKQMKDRGWITERDLKKPGKGRPCKVYSLKTGFKDIISALEEEQIKIIVRVLENIERLKKNVTKAAG